MHSNYIIFRFFLLSLLFTCVVGFYYRDTLYLPQSSKLAENKFVTNLALADFLMLRNMPGTLVVDIRKEKQYNFAHIPESINLPANVRPEDIPEEIMYELLNSTVIIFLDVDEQNRIPENLELILKKSGIKQIKLYNKGWRQWKACALPIVGGDYEE